MVRGIKLIFLNERTITAVGSAKTNLVDNIETLVDTKPRNLNKTILN